MWQFRAIMSAILEKAVKRKVRFGKPVREPCKVRVGTDRTLRKMALEPGCR